MNEGLILYGLTVSVIGLFLTNVIYFDRRRHRNEFLTKAMCCFFGGILFLTLLGSLIIPLIKQTIFVVFQG